MVIMSKRKLKIDIDDLKLAFDNGVYELQQFLDLQSGEIVLAELASEEAEAYEASEYYLLLPHQDSAVGYEDMRQFIATVRHPHFRELLEVSIVGSGAFRRFREVVVRDPIETQRWHQFKEKRLRERILLWLESYDIELLE